MGFPAKLYLAWRRRFRLCVATCTEAVVERVGSKATDLEDLCSDLGSVDAKMIPCFALKGDYDFEDVPSKFLLGRTYWNTELTSSPPVDDTDLTASLPRTRLGFVKPATDKRSGASKTGYKTHGPFQIKGKPMRVQIKAQKVTIVSRILSYKKRSQKESYSAS
jgi:hypothetical protein